MLFWQANTTVHTHAYIHLRISIHAHTMAMLTSRSEEQSLPLNNVTKQSAFMLAAY
jgi:hypothetical protein